MSHPAPALLSKILPRFGGTLNHTTGNVLPLNRGWIYLASLLAIALLFTFWLGAGQVDAHTLFQSPASPPPAPPPAEPPPAAPPPAAPPPVEAAPIPAEPPAAQPQAVPPAAEQPPVEVQPAAQPAPAQAQPQAQPPADQNLVPEEPDQPGDSEPSPREASATDEEPSSGTGFSFDQAEFIDTVVVSGAYIWLCCGVVLLLVTPLTLLFVYIRGRSKLAKEERFQG